MHGVFEIRHSIHRNILSYGAFFGCVSDLETFMSFSS
jgi:hypothetical protein